MRKIKKRKAQAHVEMIISFVIFIGFISVLLILLNPLKDSRISTTILDTTETQLLEEISLKYKTLSLAINEGVDQASCFKIDNVIGITDKLIVKDKEGNIRNSKIDSNYIYVDSSSDRFYELYFSDNFSEYLFTSTCDNFLSQDQYSFGILNIQEKAFIKKIKGVAQMDYSDLKEKLELTNDFEFYVYYAGNKSAITNATLPYKPEVDIVARDIPLIAIDKDGNLIGIIINIRAW